MNRRHLLTALAGTIPIAGCSDVIDNSRDASTDGNSSQAPSDDSTRKDVGLTNQQRAMFQEHGWTSAQINCFEDFTLKTLRDPTQAKFNQEVFNRLEELDQAVAKIDRLTTESVIKENNVGIEDVFIQHTFHGVELENTTLSPYNTQVGPLACTETPTATNTSLGANRLETELGSIEASHVNQDGTVKRTIKAAPLYDSGSRQITYYPSDKSKQTTIFETNINYPKPQITIELVDINIDNVEYSDLITIEYSIKVVNYGPNPSKVDISGPDNIPLFGTILYVDEPFTETYNAVVDSEKQGETVTFAVTRDTAGITYDEISFKIPEA